MDEQDVNDVDRITVREMVVSDYSEVYQLWSRTDGMGLNEADSEEAIRAFLTRNAGHSFVSVVEDEIVGTVLCGHDGRRGMLYHVAVTESHRKRGIGKKLVNQALDRLRSIGIQKCHLMVYAHNELGNEFWQREDWVRRDDILLYSKRTG